MTDTATDGRPYTPEEALRLLHDGEVDGIMWDPSIEQIERDRRMWPDRRTLYMVGHKHPTDFAVDRTEART